MIVKWILLSTILGKFIFKNSLLSTILGTFIFKNSLVLLPDFYFRLVYFQKVKAIYKMFPLIFNKTKTQEVMDTLP